MRTGHGSAPTRRAARLRTAALALAGLIVTALPALHAAPAAAAGTNLALGKSATASSVNGQYAASNLNDGNQASYWESTNEAPSRSGPRSTWAPAPRSTRSC